MTGRQLSFQRGGAANDWSGQCAVAGAPVCFRLLLWYIGIDMQRMMITLSDVEYEALRTAAFTRRVPMVEVIREALDALLGTDHHEIGRPGRQPGQTGRQP